MSKSNLLDYKSQERTLLVENTSCEFEEINGIS